MGYNVKLTILEVKNLILNLYNKSILFIIEDLLYEWHLKNSIIAVQF